MAARGVRGGCDEDPRRSVRLQCVRLGCSETCFWFDVFRLIGKILPIRLCCICMVFIQTIVSFVVEFPFLVVFEFVVFGIRFCFVFITSAIR